MGALSQNSSRVSFSVQMDTFWLWGLDILKAALIAGQIGGFEPGLWAFCGGWRLEKCEKP